MEDRAIVKAQTILEKHAMLLEPVENMRFGTGLPFLEEMAFPI